MVRKFKNINTKSKTQRPKVVDKGAESKLARNGLESLLVK